MFTINVNNTCVILLLNPAIELCLPQYGFANIMNRLYSAFLNTHCRYIH